MNTVTSVSTATRWKDRSLKPILAVCSWMLCSSMLLPQISFVEVSRSAGLNHHHGYEAPTLSLPLAISGGVAAGDYDRDGWVDLYVVCGEVEPNRLYRNLGSGRFEEVGAVSGLGIKGKGHSGPSFGDVDGDGWLDLIINGVDGSGARLFRNKTDGTFEEISVFSGLPTKLDSFSASFGDPDRDGDLDILQTHWQAWFLVRPCQTPCTAHLWLNDGSGTFTDSDAVSGIVYDDIDHTFTANFADINNDRWPDILFTSDFNSSRVYLNDGDGTFTDITDPRVITDQTGMGAAVGDYDNDLDLDWFVTAIYSPSEDLNGNRLYRNRGDGGFEDVTDAANVRGLLGADVEGSKRSWGWGACFADFDNDGCLDIFHVNGWERDYHNDRSRLFMSNGDGTFSERSTDYGLVDEGNGRGVSCFDYDRDGDIDIFVANNSGRPSLWRNDGGNRKNFLNLELRGSDGRHSIGARVVVTAGGQLQMREVQAGNNFVSQNPQELHFGLGRASLVDRIEIEWPDGLSQIYVDLGVNRFLQGSESGLRVRHPRFRQTRWRNLLDRPLASTRLD